MDRRRRIDAIAKRLEVGNAPALLRRGADDFFHDQRAGHAAPARGIKGVFNGDVVIGDDLHGAVQHFGRHVEVHHVALVVLHDEQHAGSGIHLGGGLDHLIGSRRCEDLAWTGGVQHAVADEAAMQRFVARTSTGDKRHLAGLQRPAANEFMAAAERQYVGMGGSEAVQAFGQHRIDGIDEFLHGLLPNFDPQPLSLPNRPAICCTNSATARSSAAFCCSSPRSGTVIDKCRVRRNPAAAAPCRGWARS